MLIEKRGLNLQTNTVVESVEAKADGAFPFPYIHLPRPSCMVRNTLILFSNWVFLYIGSHTLHTPRGTLNAQKVIYCSNAYTATLLPEFKGKIAPFRGQCSAIVPTRAVSGTKMLKETMSYRWGLVRLFRLSLVFTACPYTVRHVGADEVSHRTTSII